MSDYCEECGRIKGCYSTVDTKDFAPCSCGNPSSTLSLSKEQIEFILMLCRKNYGDFDSQKKSGFHYDEHLAFVKRIITLFEKASGE